MIRNILMRVIFLSTVLIGSAAIWPIFFMKNIKKLYMRFVFFGIFVLYFGLDRLTKYLVVSGLDLHQTIPVLKDVFHITYIRNAGAAFGILQNKVTFFILIAFISIFMIVFYAFSRQADKIWVQVALGSLLGGACGNLYDRILYGYVIDFLDFRYIDFPIFNFADVVIDIGIVMLCWEIIFSEEEQKGDINASSVD
ncbi:MAG: signal peptidase II [Candidatus Muirbacterium halophilum]|nr:signal peptidase II [Candidatus Muirbacterium halophilum]MCK9475362.1 signal peptidase II [Candidatus Muirbacterium halophilum]